MDVEYEKVLKEALKYRSKLEWSKGCRSSYIWWVKNGKAKEIVAHMNIARDRWIYEDVLQEAKKFTSKKSWDQGSPGSYSWWLRNGKPETT